MGFLSGVLPGLREIRPALVSGYLWLAVLWFGFYERIPRKSEVEPDTLADAVKRITSETGEVGTAVAVSLLAWVIGIATQGTAKIIARSSPLFETATISVSHSLKALVALVLWPFVELAAGVVFQLRRMAGSEPQPGQSQLSALARRLKDTVSTAFQFEEIRSLVRSEAPEVGQLQRRIRVEQVLAELVDVDAPPWAYARADDIMRRDAELDLRRRMAIPLALAAGIVLGRMLDHPQATADRVLEILIIVIAPLYLLVAVVAGAESPADLERDVNRLAADIGRLLPHRADSALSS